LQQLQKAQEEQVRETKSMHSSVPLKERLSDEEIQHIELYRTLRKLTDALMYRDDVPSYIVANSKTLIELCKALPFSEDDLLQVKGFGQAKVEKYGKDFLDVINAYCTKNNLASQMELYKQSHVKRERKADTDTAGKTTNPTREVSLTLWKELKSLAEVAKARNLAESTIAGHLAQCVAQGSLDVFELTTREVLDKVLQAIPESMESMGLSAVKEKLGDEISYHELKWALAWKKYNDNKKAADYK
jgi:ribonuclease D